MIRASLGPIICCLKGQLSVVYYLVLRDNTVERRGGRFNDPCITWNRHLLFKGTVVSIFFSFQGLIGSRLNDPCITRPHNLLFKGTVISKIFSFKRTIGSRLNVE